MEQEKDNVCFDMRLVFLTELRAVAHVAKVIWYVALSAATVRCRCHRKRALFAMPLQNPPFRAFSLGWRARVSRPMPASQAWTVVRLVPRMVPSRVSVTYCMLTGL